MEDKRTDNKVGEEIRRQIKNRGLSLTEAAKKLGLSKQAFGYILSEKKDGNWREFEIEYYCEKLRLNVERVKGAKKGVI